MTISRKGKCLCGAVTFTTDLEASHFDVCHCGTCRKWGGGPAFACTAASLDIAPGAPVTWFDSSDHAERGFCMTCGTHLFWRLKDGGFISVFAGSLDDLTGLDFAMQIFTDEQPAAYAFANDTKKMTGAEVFAAFGGEST